MKIIHTSDWHLGHSLYNYDRSEEQQDFLEQLRLIVEREQPDVLLVCGDIYHTTTPASATQKMYTDGLLAIHQASPHTQIIVTAGNHDSCAKLEIDRNLWQHFHVTVIGSIARKADRTTDWEQHIIEIKDKEGVLLGYVGAVPHAYPHNFPSENGTLDREERQPAFFQGLLDYIGKRNTSQLPVILTAHLAVREDNGEIGDKEIIGGMDTVPVEQLGSGYDYLALGHIHYPHRARNDYPVAAYSGSPIAVDFDEDYPHSVTLLEINRHGETPELHHIEIQNPRPLTTLPPKATDLEEALHILEEWPEHKKDYIRLHVKANRSITPDIVERIIQIMKNKNSRYCYIKINRETETEKEKRQELSIEELKQKSPLEIARLYYEEKEGAPMEEDFAKMMQEAWQQVSLDQEDSK